MISAAAVKQLQSDKNEIVAKIQGLQAEVSRIDAALTSLTGAAVSSAGVQPAKKKYVMTAAHKAALAKARAARWNKATPATAPVAKPVKKQRSMSQLGKLRIKLGSLNRYKKTEEAKKVQAQIAALEAKAAKK